MSLLMKALEKAAKDREEGNAGHPPAVPGGGAVTPNAGKPATELSLEPIAQQRAATQPTAGREPTMSPRKPEGTAPRTPAAAASPESAQAAAVLRAGQREAGGGISAYVREHPMIVFSALAALFLIAYGSYVYLQMTNPAMFAKPPVRPAQSVPIVPAPAPAASGGTVTAEQPPIPLTSLLPPLQAGAEQEKPAPAPVAPAAAATTGTATASVAAAPASVAPASVAPAPQAARDTIKITAGGASRAINPLLVEAYQALNAGDLESSQRLYDQLLRSEPNNIDALLGLAAITTQQADGALASKHYLRMLELDPRNALAQAGLIGMLGRADPLAAETRLKQLIERDPSAYLYFTLGNVYADQDRWPDAQQAYFQAHHLQPGNPDYAYNLAVGLEHVGQAKLALNFYRSALQLATAAGRANFSTATVQERIGRLEKVVE